MVSCDFLDQHFLDCILKTTPVVPIFCLCAACWAHSCRDLCWLTSVKLLSWTDMYMYLSVYRETSYRHVSVLYDCVRTLELCRICECDGRWVLPIALCEALVSIKLAGCVGACVGERGWLTRRWEEVRRRERETARVTFGHLSPFPYIVLRYANVTYKALDRASRTCTMRYTHASYPWIHMNTYVQLFKRTYSRYKSEQVAYLQTLFWLP